MCTLWASDWGVLGSDQAGFRMFPGVPSICKGRSPVRVPPRARITPRQRGFCFNVWTLSRRVPLTLFPALAWRRGRLFGCVGGGVRVLAGGPSVCWNIGVCAVLSVCFSGQLLALTHSWPGVVVTT